jgi:hypothetical protein
MALMRATQTHLLCNDTTTAHATLRQLLDLLHRQGNRQFHAEAFEAAAVLAQHTGQPTRAARYLGVRDAIRNERDADKATLGLLDDLVETSRRDAANELGQKAFEAAELAGRRLKPAAALADARNTPDPDQTHHVPSTSHDHNNGTTAEHLNPRTRS